MSARTFGHYRKLLRAGFSRYVSINRFDVARAAEPFEGASADARYDYIETDLGVLVVFAKSNKLLETFGRSTQQGEVGALLRFEEPEVIQGLRNLKPQPGDMVTIRYLEAGRTAGGRVVEADLKSEPAIIEIEYAQLLSIASLEIGTALPASDVRFVLRGPGEDEQTLDLASRRMYHFFEFIEGVRAVSNRASSQQSRPSYAEPPILRSLSVASPADLLILMADATRDLIPWGIVYGALRAASALPEKRKQWYEGTGLKLDNAIKAESSREARLLAEKKELEVERQTRENDLVQELIKRVRAVFPDSTASDEAIARYTTEFVLPPLRGLAEAGIDDVRPPDNGPQDDGDHEPG